jgi:hypothetical protein
MTKGILIYALNNKNVDYVKIALYAAARAKTFLDYPITLVTDSREWLETQYPTHTSIVDNVIFISDKPSNDIDTFYHSTKQQHRTFRDGTNTHKLEFKNDIRVKTYEITPYDETLVIDCDYIINDDILNFCWDQPNDFLIFKKAQDLSYYRHDPLFYSISDTSIEFYWATVFWFRKNKNTQTFFNLLEHIQDNWNFYRYLYQISYTLYRNDYAFSIAIHIMNGFQKGDWANAIPGTLYYTTDRDLLLSHVDSTMKFLIEKENLQGQYVPFKTNAISIHVMNKFSVARIADEVNYV